MISLLKKGSGWINNVDNMFFTVTQDEIDTWWQTCDCAEPTDLQHHADVGFDLGRVFGELLREAETHSVSIVSISH